MASPIQTDSTLLIRLKEVTSTGKVIGKGAYGRVIEVYVHGTLCAAKEVHPILVEGVTRTEYETTKQSFLTECANASRIHHPNVVQVLGIHYPTPEAKLPWLVMEMMECSIKGMLEKYEKDKVPVHIKLSILVDIAQGLEFLHGQDIVHRDLSSNNVLLTIHFVAKIADLGVAKVIEHNKMKTQTQAPGTSDFMPPEALLRRPKYGKPVDVFSLGCIACHVMSHQWPEPKDLLPEDSMTALTEVQRRENYFHSFTDSSLKKLIQCCLNNVPRQRPQIPAICIQLKDLKASANTNVSIETANTVELFNAVQNERKQIDKLASTLAQMETAIIEKDNKLQEKDREIQQNIKKILAKDIEMETKDKSMQQRIKILQDENKQLQEKYVELQQKDKIVLKTLKEVQEMDKGMQEQNLQLYDKMKEIQEKTHSKMQEKIKEMLENITEKQEQLKSKGIIESSKMVLHNQKTNFASDTLAESGDYRMPLGSTSRSTNATQTTREPVSTANTVSESTTTTIPKHGKLDLSGLQKNIRLKEHLLRKKEAKVQVEDEITKPKCHDYDTINAIHPYARTATRLANKLPVAAPCYNKDSAFVEYWQCAVCEIVNEVKRNNCKKCCMTCGYFSALHVYCGLCNLKVYVSEERMNSEVDCPMCKEVLQANKPPVAAPCYNKDSVTVEYWQCAVCQIVNEVKRNHCKKCNITCGSFSALHVYCGLCNLKVYVSAESMHSTVCCPMCKEVLHTTV